MIKVGPHRYGHRRSETLTHTPAMVRTVRGWFWVVFTP